MSAGRRGLLALLCVGVLAVAGWFGWTMLTRDRGGAAPVVGTAIPDAATPAGGAAETVETVDAGSAALPTGGTPMAQRVAVVGLLNKRNGESRELTLHPGQAVRVGDAIVRLRACEKTAPWEDEPLTGAFVQLDVRGTDSHWRRFFSGWLFKEQPALNVVQHPVYDVWTKSCTMSWPATGPDTVSVAPGVSSARKSPPRGEAADDDAQGDDAAVTTSDSADDSNAM